MHPAPTTPPPVALTIAGSDPSGGAGIQADLKTFSALGAYGTSVLTALTAQATTGVTGVHEIPVDFVRAQLDTLLADVRIDTVKIGMLGSAALAHAVGTYLTGPLADTVRVLDPVMVATSGSRLLAEDAVDAVRMLLPHADVITPNLPEAAVLTGHPQATDLDGMRIQARLLRDGYGARRILLKGGHLTGSEEALDLWLDGDHEEVYRAPRVHTGNTHGTGCTLSSALAALYPRHTGWPATVAAAKTWLTGALLRADELRVGSGSGPVHHFHEDTHRWRPARTTGTDTPTSS
ncbi:hydroxymethylpyrimidine/phosphomethylpyrimidine kinase [Austwickia chelonae]|uniref:Phosphomethylpyrimidine kinase n=1 Tax=Austwickia chelonae NBRC 105200 TaxID=1184607 RepID=K6VUB6_9MICO|nr:bifunctional hydroxymethylpyrimidine kinase/phosphomethylpyrimidine kinase [Austwickia chelonae]GAB78940.1 phosphomethylpyrimidine kinase [Austwickia chelonae NBRC 105200]SEV86959.1 hydroxymethylpyrimidine/phosphomethylpyrimidine kinase [Austwickia chelonae]